MNKTLKKKKNRRRYPLAVVILDERFRREFMSNGFTSPEGPELSRRILRNQQMFTSVRSKKLADQKNVILVSKASRLAEISGFIRELNEKNYLKGLFIRPDVKTELLPKLMHESGVATLKYTFIHNEPEALYRFLRAWNLGAPDSLVADASVADETLFVVNCSSKLYKVRFDDLPALGKIALENRKKFEIDEDGSYIHWPNEDIHIDIDTLKYHTDEEYRKKADLKRLQYHREFGLSLKNLRQQAGLRQNDIPGLSARQVRRIENGKAPVTSGALEKLADAMGLEPDQLMKNR